MLLRLSMDFTRLMRAALQKILKIEIYFYVKQYSLLSLSDIDSISESATRQLLFPHKAWSNAWASRNESWIEFSTFCLFSRLHRELALRSEYLLIKSKYCNFANFYFAINYLESTSKMEKMNKVNGADKSRITEIMKVIDAVFEVCSTFVTHVIMAWTDVCWQQSGWKFQLRNHCGRRFKVACLIIFIALTYASSMLLP